MTEVIDAPNTLNAPLPVNKVYFTKVSNGFLVETKDRHYNGEESVYFDIETALEKVRTSFNG